MLTRKYMIIVGVFLALVAGIACWDLRSMGTYGLNDILLELTWCLPLVIGIPIGTVIFLILRDRCVNDLWLRPKSMLISGFVSFIISGLIIAPLLITYWAEFDPFIKGTPGLLLIYVNFAIAVITAVASTIFGSGIGLPSNATTKT